MAEIGGAMTEAQRREVPGAPSGAPTAAGPPHRGVGPVHHVVLNVADISRSTWFYGELLGLHKTLQTTVGGAAFETLLRLAPGTTARICYFDGGIRLGQLELVQWSVPPGREAPEVSKPTPTFISFQVDEHELDRLHERLRGADIRCWSSPVALRLPRYGEIRAFIGEDPDGHPIEFVALPSAEKAKQEYRGGEE